MSDTESTVIQPHGPHGQSITDVLRRELVDAIDLLAADVFSTAVSVKDKGGDGIDLVTSIDYEIQARLTELLPGLLPGSKVVGEEDFSGLDNSCRYVWLVDPLDGTVNFVGGLLCYAIAVVLLDNGKAVLAAVRDIPRAVTYSALHGGGAMRGDARLVTAQNHARLGAVSSGLIRNLALHAPLVLANLLTNWKLRNLGSQALQLCYLAEGSLKFVASYEARAWDDLAGSLIASECGLVYGSYVAGSKPADAPQMSLCAPRDIFDDLALLFANSVNPSG